MLHKISHLTGYINRLRIRRTWLCTSLFMSLAIVSFGWMGNSFTITAAGSILSTYLSVEPIENNSVQGVLLDLESSLPIPFAYIHLEEVNRTAVSNVEGIFELTNIPRGVFHLSVHRLGYKSKTIRIEIAANDTLRLESDPIIKIYLEPQVLSGESVLIQGSEDGYTGSTITHVSKKLNGTDLRKNLGATLAETISNLPGISQRTNGTATARPVIRGLGDERVQIRQDGIASSDISSQSSDHAVTIDASSAEEIQIARGPAALRYGANAVGGIINVVKNSIPTSIPNKFSGSFSLMGVSGTPGASIGIEQRVPIPSKSMVFSLDAQAHRFDDMRSPNGPILNSFNNSERGSFGVSHITKWGYIGVSGNALQSSYGIPPNPDGHAEGVDIDMNNAQLNLSSEILLQSTAFTSIQVQGSMTQYSHIEYESPTIVGSEFGLVTQSFQVHAMHERVSFLQKGSIGFSLQHQDYAVNGADTPNSESVDIGLYWIETTDWEKLHVEWGGRLDFAYRTPDNDNPNSIIGFIQEKDYLAYSSSFSMNWALSSHHGLQAMFLHSFRAPSLEELYSEGPHLASYSFEIGNPNLNPERALAKEIGYSLSLSNLEFNVTGYHNGFGNYNFAVNTGVKNNRYPTLFNYQFSGVKARMYGIESEMRLQLRQHFFLDLTAHYLKADIKEANELQWGPMPYTPPFSIKSRLSYRNGSTSTGVSYHFSAEQTRIGNFELPSSSYSLVDVYMQHEWMGNKSKRLNGLHTIRLRIDNVLNESYYNHLSRIKNLATELGISANVMYRYYF